MNEMLLKRYLPIIFIQKIRKHLLKSPKVFQILSMKLEMECSIFTTKITNFLMR